jgi:hypothetical protein
MYRGSKLFISMTVLAALVFPGCAAETDHAAPTQPKDTPTAGAAFESYG